MGAHSHTYIVTNRAFIDPLILINGEGVKQGMRLVERLGALVCVRAYVRACVRTCVRTCVRAYVRACAL